MSITPINSFSSDLSTPTDLSTSDDIKQELAALDEIIKDLTQLVQQLTELLKEMDSSSALSDDDLNTDDTTDEYADTITPNFANTEMTLRDLSRFFDTIADVVGAIQGNDTGRISNDLEIMDGQMKNLQEDISNSKQAFATA